MLEIFAIIALAAAMFAGTNADTLVILGLCFAQPACRPREVIWGALVGIGFLTALSAGVSLLAVGVIHDWIPLLGIVPIILGLAWLRSHHDRKAPVHALRWWTVAGLTIADGADNLAVNIPVFALQSGAAKLLIAVVFLVLTVALCLFAWAAVKNPLWGPRASRICTRAAPFVLVGIGLWTLVHHPIFKLDFAAHPLFGRAL